MILTIDLGTSTTKAAVWGDEGLLGFGRSPVPSRYPQVGRVEQDPADWWRSVVAAVRLADPTRFGEVSAIGFATARQTFVPVTESGDPLGPALVWSDRRAADVAGKVAWLCAHEPERMSRARWLVGPRDLVAWHMSGEASTDVTVAFAYGLADEERIPAPVPSTTVVGALRAGAADELGLPAGVPIVIGAGDRQCEVLGAGATMARPSVSWGTTANVSAPAADRPEPCPPGLAVHRGALGGWQVEGGVSAAGSLLGWIAQIASTEPQDLWDAAARSEPGARGVVALPWLGGARAPWWQDAGAAFLGLSASHGVGDLARAAIEAVAWDLARCLDLLPEARQGLCLVGRADRVWAEIVTAVTGLPGLTRRSDEAASVGASMLTATGLGLSVDLDVINPVVASVDPDPGATETYRDLRATADAAARAVIGL